MSFRKHCPKCQKDLVGNKINFKDHVSAEHVMGTLSVNGHGRFQLPAKVDLFYQAIIECSCGASLCDFLLGSTQDPFSVAEFNQKKKLYENSDILTEQMLEKDNHSLELKGGRP
jgi:hypothetical protein